MAEAIAQVREALGEEAIIVATREGPDGVRVTAAVEGDAAPAPQPKVTTGPAAPFSPKPPQGSEGISRPRPRPEPEKPILSPAGGPGSAFATESIYEAIRRHGMPGPLGERLMAAAGANGIEDSRACLARALETVFGFAPVPEDRPVARPLAFVGPPGSGKTLAVAKLAAVGVMNGLKVGVITTDTIRAGGVEQLAAFTRILKLDLMTADTALVLADCVSALGHCDQILIDTGGRNPFNPDDMEELAELLSVAPLEPLAVLAAGGDPTEAADIAAGFQAMGAERLLVSRIDMTRRLGGIFAAAEHLAFCNVSNTPRVAEGLPPLTSGLLASLMLSKPSTSARYAAQRGTGTT
jgi:flagellar biosynthesis protein FlhF